MENQEELFTETIELVCLNLEDDKSTLLNNPDFISFHKSLSQVIKLLLYNDYKKLINILYKMDINETKYQKLFKDLPSDQIAEGLADLMIERAKQKAVTRRKYKNG
jgi:hypothetical protein